MISVIVPVYKVEKYLDKCVQSILAQTYKDFELILVDDGSPDNCPQLCDEYSKKDKRVRVIHKENGGLSDARNAGTAIAEGDYVTYIDSDDYISEDYLETLWTLINKYKADIAVTGMCTFFEGDKVKLQRKINEYCYNNIEALEHMLYQDNIDTSACAMLIPRDLACNNPFPVGKYHEDDFTTYKFYSCVKKVVVTTKSQYFYLQRMGSIMHVSGRACLDEIEATNNLVTFCEDNYPELVRAANSKKFSNYCQMILKKGAFKEDDKVVNYELTSFINKIKWKIVFDKRCRFKNKIAAISLIFGIYGLRILNLLRK